MSFSKFAAIFALMGFLVPLVLRTMWHFLNQNTNLDAHFVAEKLMLVLWPTSLMTLPTSPEAGFETRLFLLSLAANVIIYTAMGMLVWLALWKHIGFFAVAGIPAFAMWWWLLTR